MRTCARSLAISINELAVLSPLPFDSSEEYQELPVAALKIGHFYSKYCPSNWFQHRYFTTHQARLLQELSSEGYKGSDQRRYSLPTILCHCLISRIQQPVGIILAISQLSTTHSRVVIAGEPSQSR